MSEQTDHGRATLEYDPEHEAALMQAVTAAIFEASMVSDANAIIIRTGEAAEALLTVLAGILAMSPAVTRSPTALRTHVDELGKRLRRKVSAAETSEDLQEFLRRTFRGGGQRMSSASDYSGTCSRKGRSMAQRSRDLIDAMYAITEAARPITGRGVGYKLFTRGLIASMARSEMQRVYRLLKEAREQGAIPWGWIVDETRNIERVSTWSDPAEYASCVARSYRRDFWDQQPHRVQVWSEKGTVRGVLRPVLDRYAVGFNPVHGFNSATSTYDVSQDVDSRPLMLLYVGDFDPSGMFMSEEDLPTRFARYGGDHITIKRIALTVRQLEGLPSFPATDKKKDPRYKWFRSNFAHDCWELDAMDPNDLRDCVEQAIVGLIEPVAWQRCEVVNRAEQESLQAVLEQWGAA